MSILRAIEVGACPKKLVSVPGFPTLHVECDGIGENAIAVLRYVGSAADLLASGAAEPDMLTPGRKGRERRDRDGDYYHRRAYRVGPEGQRLDRFMLLRKKHASKLPGSAAAIAAFRAYEAWFSKLRLAAPALRSGIALRPQLRLVVDNTRSEQP